MEKSFDASNTSIESKICLLIVLDLVSCELDFVASTFNFKVLFLKILFYQEYLQLMTASIRYFSYKNSSLCTEKSLKWFVSYTTNKLQLTFSMLQVFPDVNNVELRSHKLQLFILQWNPNYFIKPS